MASKAQVKIQLKTISMVSNVFLISVGSIFMKLNLGIRQTPHQSSFIEH